MLHKLFCCAFLFFWGISGIAQNYPYPAAVAPFTVETLHPGGCEFLFATCNLDPSGLPFPNASVILDQHGQVVFYFNDYVFDFKLQPSGRMSYHKEGKNISLDSNFNRVDTVDCLGGYDTDIHDYLQLEEGISVLYCWEEIPADLRFFTTSAGAPGDSIGIIKFDIIQEVDSNGAVIWEWHGADHFHPTDTDERYFYNPSQLDLMHVNSIRRDSKGNYLISNRNMNEVTLVSRETGEIMWRFGGKKNEFALDSGKLFWGQHDVRFLNDSTITMFDNGNFHVPPFSRAVAYRLDTATMTATQLWEFEKDSIQSETMGSVQVLENGNIVIYWGWPGSFPYAKVSELDSSGDPVREIQFFEGYRPYRVSCAALPFDLNRPEIVCAESGPGVAILDAGPGHPNYLWSTGETTQSITVDSLGMYYVLVDRGIGKISSEVFPVTDLSAPCLGPVGVVDGLRKEPLSLIPSPNAGTFQVSLPDGAHGSKLMVRNVQGKLVWESRVASDVSSMEIQLPAVPAGVYFLELLDERRGVRWGARFMVLDQ